MFWDKKEDKKMLEDIPPLKLPERSVQSSIHEDEEDEEYSEKHGLPSFPDSPQERGFSQAAIKEAINNNDMEKYNSEYETIKSGPPTNIRTIEMKEWEPEYKLQDPSKDPLIEKMRSFSQRQKGSEEFINFSNEESTYMQKNLLSSQLEALNSVKRLHQYKRLREEEFSMKIKLKPIFSSKIAPAQVPRIGFPFFAKFIKTLSIPETDINLPIVVDSPPGIVIPSTFSKSSLFLAQITSPSILHFLKVFFKTSICSITSS